MRIFSTGLLSTLYLRREFKFSTMKSTLPTYSLYDLSNPHFAQVTVLTNDDKVLEGQFVQFKVVKDHSFEFLYPAEKYCFLPEAKRAEFWSEHILNNGEFTDMPPYILQLGLNDLRSICIKPLLSV